ncbi:hypothetical protein WR25_15878 [Diploscapter pachys]|uniref:Uncharacterized protein n=1 Tax=Diploscapter pachys TaxID=2018661 RepID=A0A2A2KEZ6_9BILA|nr:hypothetical protein WR25_15878 [Diploscapter pachys]
MPTTLSTVTTAMAASTMAQAGMAGKAMLRNSPISRPYRGQERARAIGFSASLRATARSAGPCPATAG